MVKLISATIGYRKEEKCKEPVVLFPPLSTFRALLPFAVARKNTYLAAFAFAGALGMNPLNLA